MKNIEDTFLEMIYEGFFLEYYSDLELQSWVNSRKYIYENLLKHNYIIYNGFAEYNIEDFGKVQITIKPDTRFVELSIIYNSPELSKQNKNWKLPIETTLSDIKDNIVDLGKRAAAKLQKDYKQYN